MSTSALRLLALLCFTAARLPAAEPWADARLTVTNGLLVWIDASRQSAARGAAGLSPLQLGRDATDILFEGSGRANHLRQPALESRPRFRQEFNGALLTFDGTNDFMAASLSGTGAVEATVFVVAAPRANGGFRAFCSFAPMGRNDFVAGLNFDLSGNSAPTLDALNAEGAGFSRAANLLSNAVPLGRWHVFTLAVRRDAVRLFMDGRAEGSRPRNAVEMRLDEFTLGARRYSHTAERPHVQDYFKGDIAEVVLFDRALTDKERGAVGDYLGAKYGALLRALSPAAIREGAVPFVAVSNPPPVQVFAPGFTARELPVSLNNINNVRYRPDGRLVAVGYDGRVWLLSDTDGDGLEDRAEAFWEKQTFRAPIGAALTLPGDRRGDGVFIAAKERMIFLVDTNGDGRADEDRTIATWTERSEQQGVDALGVAVGADGAVYFSIGAASYTEPFLIDKATGQPRYRTTMDRGTIQRIAPDLSKREQVCSGIRFAIGLAFNREGDLFCTDQEGATWRHDGNPLDELLHIQKGLHYGFPPRHPRHLPDVFDEPSTFDYGPQHQSTCGLQFNSLAVGGGKDAWFGPASWKDDAIVTGYSRGKLWRTKLVKSAAGYVAQTHLLATLQSLVIDACVSPRGDLIVAAHGGQPDWGSGPNGKGKLYRIRHEDRAAPQPVAAWNASATELRVAFDRPLDADGLRELTKRARIESGRFVFAGDRFETIRPGYQVVHDQLAAPRFANEVLSARVSPDRRTLGLVTRARVSAVNYAVTLPGAELLTDLTGVEAAWKADDGKDSWSGWMPHADLNVARELTRGSAEHERLFALIEKPGTLTLRGQLDAWQMLQPAIQPGAKIDWERPAEQVRVRFESSAAFALNVGAAGLRSAGQKAGKQHVEQMLGAPGKAWQPFEVKLTTGPGITLVPTWSTADDARPRPFPLRRFLLPWAQPDDGANRPVKREIPEIAGGDWQRGRAVFFGDKLACAKCHVADGAGGRVGPDLSNLTQRDHASVRKDIQFPNAAINPDHVASAIELIDGDVMNGIVLGEKDGVLNVAGAGGAAETLPRARVKAIRPAEVSLMPEGLWDGMSEAERRDLMTFLLTERVSAKR